jgi:hypothetical protein
MSGLGHFGYGRCKALAYGGPYLGTLPSDSINTQKRLVAEDKCVKWSRER